MKISTLFRALSYGELSNLAISNSGSGEIVEDKWPQLIGYANDALAAIFSRFILSEKEILIQQMAGVTKYKLLPEHALTSGSSAAHKYIMDAASDPFTGDVARILEVWGVSGSKKPLNDQEAPGSLFTPSPLELQVPEPVHGEPLSLTYQALHPQLRDAPGDNELNAVLLDQIIEIPHYLENAFQELIASKVFSHMNGQENILKSQEYLAAYEATCLGIEERDQANQSWHTSHTKLEQRGFI